MDRAEAERGVRRIAGSIATKSLNPLSGSCDGRGKAGKTARSNLERARSLRSALARGAPRARANVISR